MKRHNYTNNYIRRLMVVMMTVILTLMTTISINWVYAASTPSPSADAYIVVSGSTGEVVCGQHEERKLQVAATSSLMTAMVTIDRMHDDGEYKNKLQISREADKKGDLLQAGDKVSVKDLLYLTLVENSSEAAYALSVYSTGSEAAFVEDMNSKAKELGAVDTNYKNVTGTYDIKQFSTAADTATILSAASRYSVISTILKASTHKIKVDGKTKDFMVEHKNNVKYSGITLSNSITCDSQTESHVYYGMSVDDGMEIIVVMLGTNPSATDKDAAELFTYGNKNVTRLAVVQADTQVGKIRVRGGARTRVPVYTKTKGYVYIPSEGSQSLFTKQVELYSGITAPVKAGTKVGEYKIYVANEFTGSVDIIVKEDIEKGWFPSYLYISNTMTIILGVILVIILLFILRVRAVQRKRERKRRLERQKRIRAEAARQKAIEEDRARRNWTYR